MLDTSLLHIYENFNGNPRDAIYILDRIEIDAATGCWNWQLFKYRNGYGKACYRGKEGRAHRISYRIFNGEIPGGLVVRHTCDNRQCCNPNHLLVGTKSDNMSDCLSRGRFRQNPVTMYGVEYISESDAARALGVLPATIRRYKRYGTLDGMAENRPKSVILNGVEYRSYREAGRSIGKKHTTIKAMVARGEAQLVEA